MPRWQCTIKTIYNPRVKAASAGVFTFKTLGNAFKKNFRKHHLKFFFLVRWHAFEHQKFTKFITKLVLCLHPDAGSQAYHIVVTSLSLMCVWHVRFHFWFLGFEQTKTSIMLFDHQQALLWSSAAISWDIISGKALKCKQKRGVFFKNFFSTIC